MIPFLTTKSEWRSLEETWIYRLALAGCDLLVGHAREALLARLVIRPNEVRVCNNKYRIESHRSPEYVRVTKCSIEREESTRIYRGDSKVNAID
jgi:hypothetical protein